MRAGIQTIRSGRLFVAILGVSLVAGCGGGVDQPEGASAGASGPTPVTEQLVVDTNGEPAAMTAVILGAASDLDLRSLVQVRVAPPDEPMEPLEGVQGDSWLYIDARVTDPTSGPTEQIWEAARLAGEVRIDTKTADLPIPLGFSIAYLGSGDSAPFSPEGIGIGSPLGTQPVPFDDQAATATHVRDVADKLGLEVHELEFRGSDSALVVKAESGADPREIVRQWPAIVRDLVGDWPDSDWLIDIRSPDGTSIKAVANSAATWTRFGWTRPDLQGYEAEYFQLIPPAPAETGPSAEDPPSTGAETEQPATTIEG